MFGKVLHNVYQVRVGQQLCPSTIGRKYIFPPADISMQYFEQRKAIVNTCQLEDDHFDSTFEGSSAIQIFNEHDESENSTNTSIDVPNKPKSSPPGMCRPIADKFPNLTDRSQASRKPKSTNWYLHHIPSPIQKNAKNQNEKARNLSILNDFANRSYLNKEVKPLRQRSQLCASFTQVRKSNISSMKRPCTAPYSKENKLARYSKPFNSKPYANFSFHSQCHSMSVRQGKDENAALKNYTEYLRKRKLNSKLKLFPDLLSIKSSVRNFKDSSSHKLKEQDLTDNNSKVGRPDTPFGSVKEFELVRPSTPLRPHNFKLLHFNTHALKTQESKLQNDLSGDKLSRDDNEPAVKIQRNLESSVASRLSKSANAKSSSKPSPAQSHNNKPKKPGNDDSRPSSKQKSVNSTSDRPVSRAKSTVQTRTSQCTTRRPQTPLEKKLMSSGVAQCSGRQKSALYELQNKLRKEKRESRKQRYFPPLGASQSFGRPITTRPATSPTRSRDATKKGATDQLKAKRKLDESYARTVMDEMKIKRPKTVVGKESEKSNTYSRVERLRHSRPRSMKPKFEESSDIRRDTNRQDERKYHSDEADIQRMKRQMFVNSITNGLKPKTPPKLKAKSSGTMDGVNERKDAQISTEREIPITQLIDVLRREPSGSVVNIAMSDTDAEAKDTKNSAEMAEVKLVAQEQVDVESAMEVDTRKRSMTSNITKSKEGEMEEGETTKPKKHLQSPADEVVTSQSSFQNVSHHKIDKAPSLEQRIAETFEAMRVAQEEVNKTEPLPEGTDKEKQFFRARYKNLYSLPNEKEISERKQRIRQISQGDVQDSKDLEAEMKTFSKKYFMDNQLSDWIKEIKTPEGRDRRRHLFMREKTKPLDIAKNLEASSKSLEKRKEDNSNRVKVTEDTTQQSSYKRKRKEPSEHRPISRSQKSKIGRYSEEIPVLKTDERSKLVDVALQRRNSKFTSPERRKSKHRRKNDRHGSSQSSQDSVDRKSHSQQTMKTTSDFHDLIDKRKVKSSVVIGEKKLKENKKKTSYSFHNLGRKPPERLMKKLLIARSIRSKSDIDLKGRSVFELWRTRLRKLKNSFFGGKE